MTIPTDIELELVWYFSGQAEANMGARSVQGGFESAMHKLALAKRGRRWDWLPDGRPADVPAHETRSTCSASDDAIERLHKRKRALEDARRIHATLQRLDGRTRAVLEMQFGDASVVHGVSVSMMCQTSRVKEACAVVNRRRAKRGRPPQDGRNAVLSLVTSVDGSDVAMLAEMAAEAQVVIDGAIRAYVEARKGR